MGMKRTVVTVRLPDGAEHTFPITVADQMKLAETSRRHKWGDVTEGAGAIMGTVFSAWYGLHRRGLTSMTWDEFKASDAEVGEADADDVDPTPSATPSAGSAS